MLRENESTYWTAYIELLPPHERPSDPRVTASIAGYPEIADELLDLYLSRRKTAGSGLVRDYENSGEPLPKVGDYWIILSRDKTPRCIVRTRGVQIHPFSKVPEAIAIAEGEGDLSLDHWRHVHAAFFTPFLNDWGVEDLSNAEVVTEFFEIVHQ